MTDYDRRAAQEFGEGERHQTTGLVEFEGLTPPYRTIVADPPWHYDESDRQGKAMPYSTMSLEDIAAMPVGELAEPGAHLYLWTTNRYLFDSRDVVYGWGFVPTQILVWAKPPGGTKPVGRFSSTTECRQQRVEFTRCTCGCEVVYHRLDLPDGPRRCTHCECRQLIVKEQDDAAV